MRVGSLPLMRSLLTRAGLVYVDRPFQAQSAARVMQMLREECTRVNAVAA